LCLHKLVKMHYSKPAFCLAVLSLLVQASCHTQSAPPLSGTLQLTTGWKPVVYLIQPRTFGEIATSFSGQVVDSAPVGADGRFVFAHLPLPTEATLFALTVQPLGSRYATQLLDDNPADPNYAFVVLKKGDALNVSALDQHFQSTFLVKNPSPEQAALRKLGNLREQSYRARQHLLAPDLPHDEHNLLEYEAAVRQFQQPLMDFADTCSTFWAALVATRWVSPSGDYERVPEFLAGQCRRWRKRLPSHPLVAQLCQAANPDKLPVLVGDLLPNAPLPMVAGDTLPLHQLLGRRLTVLDVWASWCAPCRRENRDVLVPLWAQYHEKGLQIVGYSLDASGDAWRAAIAKDQAAWPHASHLSGDTSPFTETLRITTIPANFLLDSEGRVVAKNLHGAELVAFVKKYLEEH
jgi:thiol-disulfide isomerase/thioredoxin